MARVTVVFTDSPGGGVDMALEAAPPIPGEANANKRTAAQTAVLIALEALERKSEKWDETQTHSDGTQTHIVSVDGGHVTAVEEVKSN